MNKKNRIFLIFFACFLIASLCSLAIAKLGEEDKSPTLRPLAIQDAVGALSLPYSNIISFSPDGRSISYAVSDPRRIMKKSEDNGRLSVEYPFTEGCDIWIQAIDSPHPKNITEGRGSNLAPSWSPDGLKVAFHSNRDGKSRLWIWDKINKVRRVSEAITQSFSSIQWIPNSSQLIVILRPEEKSSPTGSEISFQALAEDKEPGSTVVIYRSIPQEKKAGQEKEQVYSGPPPRIQGDLAIVNIDSGDIRRIAKGIHTIDYLLSPDGTQVAFMENKSRDVAGATNNYDLKVINIASGAIQSVVQGIQQSSYPKSLLNWSPDSRSLSYISSNWRSGESSGRIVEEEVKPSDAIHSGCYIVSCTGGELLSFIGDDMPRFCSRNSSPLWGAKGEFIYVIAENQIWKGSMATRKMSPVTGHWSKEIVGILSSGQSNTIWSPDSRSIYLRTSDKQTMHHGFYRVDISTGLFTKLLEEKKSYGTLNIVSPDGKQVIYAAQDTQREEDLWIAGIDFSTPRRLSHINPQLENCSFGASHLIDYTNLDGKPLKASLLLPTNYKENKQYPLVVWVYASAFGSRRINRFGLVGISAFNLQMLATRGYAVLWPDIPIHLGTPMQDLMKSVIPAVDRVIEMGIADPDRLAVMGQSNGGYSTLSLIVQTSRFRAAIMNAGFGDLVGFHGAMIRSSGIGAWWPWLEERGGAMGEPPWEVPQRYIQNSPIFYLNRVTTPLMIQAGSADDYIVPFSDQVFVGLKRQGKDVVYLRYDGEGHVIESYANLVDHWNRIIKFLDVHLKKESPSTPSELK